MLMRPSSIAVAIVVAISAAAATTQVVADDEVATPVAIDLARPASADRIDSDPRQATAARSFQARN